ncbi:hypothetical protein D3C86_2072690 [compost metagenome]
MVSAGSAICSGVVSTMRALPLSMAARADASSSLAIALLICTAATPSARRASHWSFISATSGETTTVVPGSSRAGNW